VFASYTGWLARSTAYGVASGTSNWDGDLIGGPGSASAGRNLLLSYRHGWTTDPSGPLAAQDNQGRINALMFDGHVGQLDDRRSRDIGLWHPTGSVVNSSSNGLTTVPDGYEIP
jgi:prepilin-type processing-associated H-X9-DG protein